MDFNILKLQVLSTRIALENFYLTRIGQIKESFLLRMKRTGYHFDMILLLRLQDMLQKIILNFQNLSSVINWDQFGEMKNQDRGDLENFYNLMQTM